MELLIASQNQNKILEIQAKLPAMRIIPINKKHFPAELKEEGKTLQENAIQKVKQVFEISSRNCFADDTGLEIDALNGEPGVYSARYAGADKRSADNIALVLKKMENIENRIARFKTVIALMWEGCLYTFEGICEGKIALHTQGENGFGYDPIFIPQGSELSFAEMSLEDKNKISHRAKAIEKLVAFLEAEFSRTQY